MKKLLKTHNLTAKDLLANLYYRVRYAVLRRVRRLPNESPFYKKGYRLTFNDEFMHESWLPGKGQKWIVGEHWGMFHPEKPNVHYVAPVLVKPGRARFDVYYKPEVLKDGNGNLHYIPFAASLLSSNKHFRQQYGRFECRMTLPKEKGTWPAFWLWGPPWPPEFDIAEGTGGATGKDIAWQGINIHWREKGRRKTTKQWFVKVDKYKGIEKRFHEYAMEWTPNSICFFFDGVKVFQFTNRKVLNSFFNQPGMASWLMVIHSLQPKGDTGLSLHVHPMEHTSYTSSFYVDYVRAYSKQF